MKTNRSAHRVVRIRAITLCLAIAAIAALDFRMGESMAERIGHTTGLRTDAPQAPNVSISDLVAAAE